MSDRKAPSIGDRVQYGVLRAFAWLLGLMSWRTATNVAGRIGTLFYSPLGIRRNVAEKQIAAAFPEFSSRDVQRVARESYRHLGRVAAETALLSRLDTAGVLEHVEGIDGCHPYGRTKSEGRGTIDRAPRVGEGGTLSDRLTGRRDGR